MKSNITYLIPFYDEIVVIIDAIKKLIDFLSFKKAEHKPVLKKMARKRKSISLSMRYKILKRDNYRCNICGKTGKKARLEIDHKYPVSKGGKDTMDNLWALCFECNRGKSDRLL